MYVCMYIYTIIYNYIYIFLYLLYILLTENIKTMEPASLPNGTACLEDGWAEHLRGSFGQRPGKCLGGSDRTLQGRCHIHIKNNFSD